MSQPKELPLNFRKLCIQEKRKLLKQDNHPAVDLIENPEEYLSLADAMVENAVGIMGIPIGITTGILIDNKKYCIPIATEEPSVIAAASYGGQIISRAGGITTTATDPVMTSQVFFPIKAKSWIKNHEDEIAEISKRETATLKQRGGGYREHRVSVLEQAAVVKIEIDIDVRDAMGANRINSVAEAIAVAVEIGIKKETGIEIPAIMAILTNSSQKKRASASFSLPLERLSNISNSGLTGRETAEKIVKANEIALEDSERAVTHNKGIMNGISGFALATANDWRAVEAAVHHWACRDGLYKSLTRYHIEGNILVGSLEIPTAFAVLGGAVNFHPTSKAVLDILGQPDAVTLSRIATALGLAQNFAALLALTGKGIQQGHMALHARRLAYSVGARGNDINLLSGMIHQSRDYSEGNAQKLLYTLDGKRHNEKHKEIPENSFKVEKNTVTNNGEV